MPIIKRFVRPQVEVAFRKDFNTFAKLSNVSRPELPVEWHDRFPCLNDRTSTTGFDGHYIYHTSWAARVLSQINPPDHVDISSSLYFVGITSAFIPVRFFDYRPADLKLSKLTTNHADLTSLPFESKSLRSISCMHVIEHIGLGRYGDPIDPDGDIKALGELSRVVASGGALLLVVPVGQPRVQFNAHRIYDPNFIVSSVGDLCLHQFALLPDNQGRGLQINASFDEALEQRYGCGCFWFVR